MDVRARLSIPRVFHRIWLDEPIPDRYEAWWRRLRELHPGATFHTWDRSDDLDWLRNRALFDAAETWAGKADIARYEVVYRYGGVYLDTDVEPLRAFDELLDDRRAFAAWESDRLICPTVIGAPPQHPALQAIIALLPRWFPRHRGDRPNYQTGPVPFTRVWRGRSDVRLLPPVTFYPVHWSEKDLLGGPYPAESFAVHHWDAGWLPGGPPQKARATR